LKKIKRKIKKPKSKRYKSVRPIRNPRDARLEGDNKSDQSLILDSFSSDNLIDWGATDRRLNQLHQNVFATLDAQRWSIYDDLCAVIADAACGPFNFTRWSRCIDYQYGDEPLSCRGFHFGVGGRFNYGRRIDQRRFKPFPALYLAEDLTTARSEYFQMADDQKSPLSAQDFALMPERGGVVEFPLEGRLHRVLNLQNFQILEPFLKKIKKFSFPEELRQEASALGHKNLKAITTLNQLRAGILETNWRGLPINFGIPANPQIFGKIVKDAGVEGIVYPSVRGPGICLVVFVENLLEDSFIKIACRVPPSVTTHILSKDTWERMTE
jgi:hypothetical protein